MLKGMTLMFFKKKSRASWARSGPPSEVPAADDGIQQKAVRPLEEEVHESVQEDDENRQLGDEHAGPIPVELDGTPPAEFASEVFPGKFPPRAIQHQRDHEQKQKESGRQHATSIHAGVCRWFHIW